jgi:DNA-directed RNA polymerase specialized sigma24 family protein
VDIKTASNIELVRLCAEDFEDCLAWEEFIERFHDQITLFVLRAYSIKTLSTSSSEENQQSEIIRDLVQQVYVRLFVHRGKALIQFHGRYERSIFAYLAQIATSVVSDYLRCESAGKRLGEPVSLEELVLDEEKPPDMLLSSLAVEELSDSNCGVRERITIEDLTRELMELLEGEDKLRDILLFVLHAFHGLNARDLAAWPWFGLTPRGVETVLRRVKEVLREARQLHQEHSNVSLGTNRERKM